MINALTIDVEDYWSILQRDWLTISDAKPTEAVVRNTHWFLEIFNNFNVKATFFILGEVAESFPSLVQEIDMQGHEIASHGQTHRQIFKATPEDFREELDRCKKYLEDLIGKPILGFRAPAFSINSDTQWALEVLAERGFRYDSSISPMAGKRYGWKGFKKEIHRVNLPSGQSIIEVPMSTISLGIKELGLGGGYLRHFPYIYTKLAIKHIQKKRPAIIYMHPYEIDVDKGQLQLEYLAENNKYPAVKFHKSQMRNRNTVKSKIEKLLSEFSFSPINITVQLTIWEVI